MGDISFITIVSLAVIAALALILIFDPHSNCAWRGGTYTGDVCAMPVKTMEVKP